MQERIFLELRCGKSNSPVRYPVCLLRGSVHKTNTAVDNGYPEEKTFPPPKQAAALKPTPPRLAPRGGAPLILPPPEFLQPPPEFLLPPPEFLQPPPSDRQMARKQSKRNIPAGESQSDMELVDEFMSEVLGDQANEMDEEEVDDMFTNILKGYG